MLSHQRILVAFVLLAVVVAASTLMLLAQPCHAAAAPLVVIDPGHGGPYSNANANRLREKDVNLWIAGELAAQLRAMGYRVVLTRGGDSAAALADQPTWNWDDARGMWAFARDGHTGNYGGIPKDDLQARADFANALGADLFISIHNNGTRSRKVRGTETWASPRDAWGRQLSGMVQRAVIRRTRLKNRGCLTTDFYVLRWSNMPAVLVEGAFITNASDARFLRTARGRQRIAQGIADGVAQWFASCPAVPVYPRVSAPDAVSLSAALASADVPAGPPAAVVARADDVNTILAATALAGRLGGPLLLAGPEDAPAATPSAIEDELARLRPKRLILAGVNGAFSVAWVERLAQSANLSSAAVEVPGGADICELTVNLARAGGVPSGEVAVAVAWDINSMTQAIRSTAARTPILLVPGASLGLGAAVSAYLSETSAQNAAVTVFGSADAIPDWALAGLPVSRRVTGADQFQTAAAELARGYSLRAAQSLCPLVVDAKDPIAQALASLRSSRWGQPVMLVSGQVLSPWTREWITNNRAAIGYFVLFERGQALPPLVDRMLIKSRVL